MTQRFLVGVREVPRRRVLKEQGKVVRFFQIENSMCKRVRMREHSTHQGTCTFFNVAKIGSGVCREK